MILKVERRNMKEPHKYETSPKYGKSVLNLLACMTKYLQEYFKVGMHP